MRRLRLVLAALVLPATACGPDRSERTMNEIAEPYVRLVLQVGHHDPGYVDAYYGPEEWRRAAEADTLSLAELDAQAAALLARLETLAPRAALLRLRRDYLHTQLRALRARVAMLGGTRFTFDEEARALYDADPPTHAEDQFRTLLAELDSILPGRLPLSLRVERFRRRFVIPPAKLDTVFRAAIDACRARTAAHLELPEGESFTVEYVTDKPWSGYNWYQGNYTSLIQVNTDLPIFIDRAIDLACHEGYPGHHAYNVLLERHLVRDRGWWEYSVYPLFSPQSLIAEGTANYGIAMAFPGDERVTFEREVLFPLAGLPADRADEYYRIQALIERLGYAGNEAARRYLDGAIDADSAARWLETYALMAPERARQRVRFIDAYRSYVINYNYGRDLVARYVETAAPAPAQRWKVFGELLSSPRLPSGLVSSPPDRY